MDGKYEIGVDHIRALAIECHALDLQFDDLFNEPTICGPSDRIYRAYNRLLSTALLNLAISIRVSLANEQEYASKYLEFTRLLAARLAVPIRRIDRALWQYSTTKQR